MSENAQLVTTGTAKPFTYKALLIDTLTQRCLLHYVLLEITIMMNILVMFFFLHISAA